MAFFVYSIHTYNYYDVLFLETNYLITNDLNLMIKGLILLGPVRMKKKNEILLLASLYSPT